MSDYRNPERFLGLGDKASLRETSAAWVLPIPFEMTTGYMGGTRNGPHAIIEASQQVEPYDPFVGVQAAPQYGIHTLPYLHPDLSSAQDAVESITQAVSNLALKDRVLVTLGGEHSITPGVVEAFKKRYRDLTIVQIDARMDLHNSVDGTTYSHVSAMRRCLPFAAQLLQFGIRSMSPEEIEFSQQARQVQTWTAEAMHLDRERKYLETLREAVAGRNVYLTIDVNGLDPSVIPAAGTPEPGGILWYDCLDLIRTVALNSHVIAFDCVELSPTSGHYASAFAAAKLVYKTLNYIMVARGVLKAVL